MSTYKNIAIKIDRLKFQSLMTRNCGTCGHIKFDKGKYILNEQDKMWNKLKFLEKLQGAIINGKKD